MTTTLLFAATALAVLVLGAAGAAQGSVAPIALVAGAAVATGAACLGLANPRIAVFYLLVTMFFRLWLSGAAPVDPFLVAFAGLAAAYLLWLGAHSERTPGPGWLGGFMALYVFWNVFSMLSAHRYDPYFPRTGETIVEYRFLLTGTVIPFFAYFVGRSLYSSTDRIRMLLWAVFGFGVYSSYVSIGQFYAPQVVFPRHVVTAPAWPERAVGVFNQPVVNGLILTIGFMTAFLLFTSLPRQSTVLRILLGSAAATMAFGIYLTHTRVAWVVFLVAVTIGAALWRGLRRGFLLTLAATVFLAGASWSTLTSADRDSGGMASTNELDDRLNGIATSLWAAGREPLFGWGIGRFPAVNTYHHQQFSPDVPWMRGYGISSHFNELGILVELGAVGLLLWLGVLVLIGVELVRAYRVTPWDGLSGRGMVLLAGIAFLGLIIVGLTVDLRFFDFPNTLVFLLAGVAVGAAGRRTAYGRRGHPDRSLRGHPTRTGQASGHTTTTTTTTTAVQV